VPCCVIVSTSCHCYNFTYLLTYVEYAGLVCKPVRLLIITLLLFYVIALHCNIKTFYLGLS